MRTSAIIVAAGSGTRLGRSEPKAFVPLAGRTLLSYSLETLSRVSEVGEIVIAVPAGMEAAARKESANLSIPVKITAGGSERQDSVRIALAMTSASSELVVVHDAARPFATMELFEACLAAAEKSGGAIAAIPLSDTLKRVGDEGTILATVPRAGLWQAQTPQAFRRAVLVAAHDRAIEKGTSATDDADLVEQIGARVELVQCLSQNPKITTQSDLAQAEALLLSRAPDRERH